MLISYQSRCFYTASAITGRWRSGQDFPRWIVLSDRFTAANLNLALARPGHNRSDDISPERPFEGPLHSEISHTAYGRSSDEADEWSNTPHRLLSDQRQTPVTGC